MAITTLIALLTALGVGGGLTYWDKKNQHSLGMKQIESGEKQNTASIQAQAMLNKMLMGNSQADRNQAMMLHSQDRTDRRMDKAEDRRMARDAMNMQILGALMQGSKPDLPEPSTGISVAELAGIL